VIFRKLAPFCTFLDDKFFGTNYLDNKFLGTNFFDFFLTFCVGQETFQKGPRFFLGSVFPDP
jgi:hypothetical protein